uniref:Uncharacterized protein n=1 Tax=Tanacetum cinerariifolium TaxID=118510 RepID=A0A699IRW6_TANCI|nr:hypothetical protein [Tanacetum cinerariifolium]
MYIQKVMLDDAIAAVQSSEQWHLFSSGSGNFLHWQWELSSLAVETSPSSGNSITGNGNALCILFLTILP